MDNYDIPKITSKELKEALDAGKEFVIIDNRPPAQYREEHIPGAINIHLNTTGDPFERQLTFMSLPADKPVVVYCDCSDESGSLQMASEIRNYRYEIKDVSALILGISQWKGLGYPVAQSES
ncbi:MAG: rhodanese-like domain-containing protein [Dehalococcoidales bacterium]|jgi:rhodanese-related sulfurtransferase|nr:rhodanese-like domain-containing protein [Dehalococcoidales bacterium]